MLGNIEGAEAGDGHPVPAHEGGLDAGEECLERPRRLGFGEIGPVRDLADHVPFVHVGVSNVRL